MNDAFANIMIIIYFYDACIPEHHHFTIILHQCGSRYLPVSKNVSKFVDLILSEFFLLEVALSRLDMK